MSMIDAYRFSTAAVFGSASTPFSELINFPPMRFALRLEPGTEDVAAAVQRLRRKNDQIASQETVGKPLLPLHLQLV